MNKLNYQANYRQTHREQAGRSGVCMCVCGGGGVERRNLKEEGWSKTGRKKKERTHGHGQQCSDCGVGREWVEVEDGTEGINVDSKSLI